VADRKGDDPHHHQGRALTVRNQAVQFGQYGRTVGGHRRQRDRHSPDGHGIAAATNGLVFLTEPQLATMIRLYAAVFRHHRWSSESLDDLCRRLAGHDEQAIWTAAYTPRKELWGHVGRKVDPTGQRPDGRPVIDLADMRRRIQEAS
jgi:hypothetical protein